MFEKSGSKVVTVKAIKPAVPAMAAQPATTNSLPEQPAARLDFSPQHERAAW